MKQTTNIESELTIEEARKLLKDLELTDEEIIKVILDLKVLCEIAANIYKKQRLGKAA